MTRPHTRSRGALLVLLAAFAVFASACMDLTTHVDLRADGSGTMEISIEFNEMMSGMMLASGGGIEDMREELLAEMTADMEVSDELRDRVEVDLDSVDGKVVMAMSIKFNDVDELTAALSSGADGEEMFTSFSLTSEGDTWTLDATANVAAFDMGMGGDDLEESVDMGVDIDVDEFGSLFGAEPAAEFTMVFPGKVTDSNADVTDGSTVTWHLLEGDGTLTATASGSGGGPSLLPLLAAIALAVVVVGGGVALFARSRNQSSPAAAATGGSQPGQWLHDDAAAQPSSAPTAGGPPAGWYPDPAGGVGRRYWDGARWTDHTS